MESMFAECNLLTSLDLNSFNTSSVTNMNSMFKNCEELTTIYVSNNIVTTNVSSSNNRTFGECTSLFRGIGSTLDSIYQINSRSYTGKMYARIDTPSTPGYFTSK